MDLPHDLGNLKFHYFGGGGEICLLQIPWFTENEIDLCDFSWGAMNKFCSRKGTQNIKDSTQVYSVNQWVCWDHLHKHGDIRTQERGVSEAHQTASKQLHPKVFLFPGSFLLTGRRALGVLLRTPLQEKMFLFQRNSHTAQKREVILASRHWKPSHSTYLMGSSKAACWWIPFVVNHLHSLSAVRGWLVGWVVGWFF